MENSPKHFLTYFMRVLLFWCIQGFRNERLPWNMTSTLMSVELQQDSASNEDVLLLFIRETQNFTKLRPKETLCVNTLFKTSPSRNITLMFCAIWYHLHNLKNVKSTHGGVLFLVLKVTRLYDCFSRFFLNCSTGIKSRNASHFSKRKLFAIGEM